jgi:hypothetical protein
MYEASAEPRLDETWIQFYGGERQGVKRLSSLDEENSSEKSNQPFDIPHPEPTADSNHPPSTAVETAPEPSPVEHAASPKPREVFPSDSGPRPLRSTVKPLRPHVKAFDHTGSGLHKPEAERSPLPDQLLDSTANNLADDGPGTVLFPTPEGEFSTFEEWSKRWSPWLKRGGSIKVCEAFFELTHARGSAECLTSNSEIMKLTDLSRAQCIRNIHYLIEIGFLDELDEVNSKDAKGTYYRFNLIPTSLVNSQP